MRKQRTPTHSSVKSKTRQGSTNEKITCKTCGKSHRSEAAFARCATKEERKAERARKKEKEKARRIRNANEEAPELFIRRLRGEGKNFEQILGALRKNYPPPQFETEWDLFTVVYTYAEGLHWGNVDTETKTMMLLEKHFAGAYITVHPLELITILGVTPLYKFTGDDFRLEKDNGIEEE
jgi:hypothetical protein